MSEATPETPDTLEKLVSQIPAVELLMKLGYHYLTPEETKALRGGRTSEVLLLPVLAAQLAKLNRVSWKGLERPFTEDAIQTAVAALRDLPDEGLIPTSEKVFDLISLGKSLPQTIEGDTRSFSLRYIDWQVPENNVFHVTEEFAVSANRPDGARRRPRPDIVLFINGIPFGVIECKKRGRDTLAEAIADLRTYQRDEEIPRLFWYAQLLLAANGESARYGTARTPAEFFAVWHELVAADELRKVLARPIPVDERVKLFWRREGTTKLGEEQPTRQDHAVYCLLRPERLLELVRGFIVYDAGQKKVARHQQFAAVKKAITRVLQPFVDGSRHGGLIWHTQGTGKSLTMVMLAKALALHPEIQHPRLILVTDRVELDKQIAETFHYCGYDPVRATDGKHLRELITGGEAVVITTIVNKFESALRGNKILSDDPNLFILVDEAHRSHFGAFHARMKKGLPRACYLGFTGTPVVKDEKRNNLERFGEFIHTYTLRHAVEDAAVVPLLYEGRHVEQTVDREQLDLWFERLTRDKTEDQKADFKRKFANADHINRAEQRLRMVAWDLLDHFTQNFGYRGCKGQLVTSRKDVALRYREIFEEIGRLDPSLRVSAEVLISGPASIDEETGTSEDELTRVEKFWKEMMGRFGNEERYNESVTNRFKGDGDPQIVIVVNKLLTGFDAPANTVLYIDRKLGNHTLLQAIARVNRKAPGKDFGYVIDYHGILGELNEALDHYDALAAFEPGDVKDSLLPITTELELLPGAYTDLWACFGRVKNQKDNAAFEACLEYQDDRDRFYERLGKFARLLQLALSSVRWHETTPPELIERYKKDLRYFMELRTRTKHRYAESVDYGEYEARIQHLIDRHVGAGAVTKLTPLTNIFDKETFDAEVAKLENPASKADTIAHRMQKTVREKWDEDPSFFRRFSEVLQQVIDDYRLRRISETEYLAKVQAHQTKLRDRERSDVPESARREPATRALYGTFSEALAPLFGPDEATEVCAQLANQIRDRIEEHAVVDWQNNPDARNAILNATEDRIIAVAASHGVSLEGRFDLLDDLLEQTLRIAKAHFPRGGRW